MKHIPTVGLALGSGGLRGFAHIGVIKTLLENNIPINFISGASIGALVGAYYSVFQDLSLLEKKILNDEKSVLPTFLDFGLKGGFIRGNKIQKFLENTLKNLDFYQTKIPLSIVATDLVSGQPVVFSQGKLAPAVHASISVPVVFKPVKFKNKLLVDGGLSDPVPVDLVKKMGADIVIAVNLYHQNEFNEKKFTMPTVALRSTRIALHNLAKIAVRKADIVLNPDTSDLIRATKINKYFDSIGTKKLIAVGARETFKHLPEIKKLLGDFS